MNSITKINGLAVFVWVLSGVLFITPVVLIGGLFLVIFAQLAAALYAGMIGNLYLTQLVDAPALVRTAPAFGVSVGTAALILFICRHMVLNLIYPFIGELLHFWGRINHDRQNMAQTLAANVGRSNPTDAGPPPDDGF